MIKDILNLATYTIKDPFSGCFMIFLKYSNTLHNMKALVILSHSWSQFFLLNYWYGENEPLWELFLEYFHERKLPQFQENSFVMGHFYNIILVQYNETWWKWCRTTNQYARYTFECFLSYFCEKEKEALSVLTKCICT